MKLFLKATKCYTDKCPIERHAVMKNASRDDIQVAPDDHSLPRYD